MGNLRKFIFQALHDFGVAVSLKLIQGVDRFSFSGFSLPLAADTSTDISLLPGVTEIPLPDNTGTAMEIVSDNVADVGNIQIFALGPDASIINAIVVTLNGTTPVAIPGLISRVNFAQSISIEGIIGTVDIQNIGGTIVYCNILEIYQRSQQALFTVAAGQRGLLKAVFSSMRKSSGADTDVSVTIKTKSFEQEKFATVFGFGFQRSGDTSIEFVDPYPDSADGPFDIKLTAISSAVGAEASGRINGLLITI